MPELRRMTRTWRLPLLALAAVTAACALSAPAGAQFWERAPRHRDYFPFSFFGGGGGGYGSGMYNPFGQAQRPQESIRPPPPRKVETQPASTVVIIGDALADWLGYGLEEALAETPEIGIVRKIRPTSGLVRYEGKSDAPDWSQAIKETLATEKPSAIIVMLGLNDRLPLRERAPVARGASKGGEQKGAEQKSGEQPGQSAAQAAPSAAQQIFIDKVLQT